MAHSIETYKGKTTVINDLDLLVIMGFAIEIIHQSASFAGFRDLETHWRRSIRQYGPGVLDLKLEQFITTPDKTRELRALLSTIVERASQHGKTVSAQVLNELISAPDVVFGDLNISYIEEAIKKLQALVAEN
jgi:hypothetical protein